MSTGFAEGGFDTNIEKNGEVQPAIESVYQFSEDIFADKVLSFVDTEAGANDERIRFVVETVRDLPEYTVQFIEDLCDSDEIEFRILASLVIQETLKQGVATNKLSFESMDVIRDLWADLMISEEEEVSDEAKSEFRKGTPYMVQHDKVTFGRIGWIASPNVVMLQPRGYSDDIQRRAISTRINNQ